MSMNVSYPCQTCGNDHPPGDGRLASRVGVTVSTLSMSGIKKHRGAQAAMLMNI